MSFSSKSELPKAKQKRCTEVCRWCRDIEGFTQTATGTLEQGFPFFHDSPSSELELVERACTLAPMDSAKILFERKGKEKTADVGVSVDIEKTAAQVSKLRRRAPEAVDDEMEVAEPWCATSSAIVECK